jgi:hypothetical protein
MLATLALTRSLSVLIIAASFTPVLFIQRKHIALTMSAILTGAVVGIAVFGDRISDAIQTSGGSVTELITASVSSWRNIPDLLILSNYRDCLFPGNPSEVRMKINTLAVLMSPALAWIQNTFSAFSAGGVTIGLLATVSIMIGGIAIGLRYFHCSPSMRGSWLMIYFAAWFFIAKWDPCAWVALGILPMVHRLNQREAERQVSPEDCEPEPEDLPMNRRPARACLAARSITARQHDADARIGIRLGLRSNYANE